MAGRGDGERGGIATAANVKRGDIFFVVGGAATGSEQEADRPAIIVSNDTGNKHAPVVEVVYLTTKKKAGLPTHVYIGSAERPSIALCEQIVTVCKSRLARHIGSVTEEEMSRVDKALSKSLGIHKAGGNAMQITMVTPFGEMDFDMPTEKATDLIQRAFQYAAGTEPEKTPQEAPHAAQEPPKASQPTSRPQSHVERMFGNFKGGAAKEYETDLSDAPEAIKKTILENATALAKRDAPEEYKGFLLIKCEHCGKVMGFCSKTPITSSRCDCGGRTELRGLKRAFLKCNKCGNQFKYQTNITDEVFDYSCLNCGSPVDLQLNKRGDTYVTIGE